MDEVATTSSATPGGADSEGRPIASRPTRFAWGVALGLGIGAIAVVAIVGAVVLTMYFNSMSELGSYDVYPDEIETVPSTEPWLDMTDDTHGTVVGWSDGSWSSGGMSHGALASFALVQVTEQDGVPARISVQVLVTRDTALLMDGEPWQPDISGDRSPQEYVFGGWDDSCEMEYLDMRELTVEFRRDGMSLIAESIDASGRIEEPPFLWIDW